jgi:[protein-PII] uridylyltransferase
MPLPKSKHHHDSVAILKKIERELTNAINTAALPNAATARVNRQAKHFPLKPEVSIRPTRDNHYHELSITCTDRPGLLSGIARVLLDAAINVHDARITTLGSRAEDVFIIESKTLDKPAAAAALTDQINALVS